MKAFTQVHNAIYFSITFFMRTVMSAFKGSLEPNTSLGGFPGNNYYKVILLLLLL
ncbi:hypothetical protein HanPSC8_Chr11g0493431 [Helianthus annuus]|nr:hypothetical protein HanPSC8_Chr11g0493431 [Helianthus annuus]